MLKNWESRTPEILALLDLVTRSSERLAAVCNRKRLIAEITPCADDLDRSVVRDLAQAWCVALTNRWIGWYNRKCASV